jgi:hypothetical protein
MESSDIKKRIEDAIREGVDKNYLDIVKDLKATYYLEDVAAAAIALYVKQGGQQGVRRRTLHNVTFIPPKTAEAKGTVEKKKPAQHPSKPVAVGKKHDVHQRPGGKSKGRRS